MKRRFFPQWTILVNDCIRIASGNAVSNVADAGIRSQRVVRVVLGRRRKISRDLRRYSRCDTFLHVTRRYKLASNLFHRKRPALRTKRFCSFACRNLSRGMHRKEALRNTLLFISSSAIARITSDAKFPMESTGSTSGKITSNTFCLRKHFFEYISSTKFYCNWYSGSLRNKLHTHCLPLQWRLQHCTIKLKLEYES